VRIDELDAEQSCWSGCRVRATVRLRKSLARHHSARAFDSMTSVKLGFKEALILAGIHIPFIGVGALLALSSKPTESGYRHGLSPGGWGFALVASYVIGFVGYMIAKR